MTVCSCVLVVEDDHSMREALREALEMEGFHVLTAKNGKDALFVLDTVKPALIFLDIMMPIMDGNEFLRIVRNSPALADISVIAASSVDPAKVKGANFFIKKPYDLSTVLSIAYRHAIPSKEMTGVTALQ